MLYRYIAVGQYASAPVNYGRLMAPAVFLIFVGVILSMAYVMERRKEKKEDES